MFNDKNRKKKKKLGENIPLKPAVKTKIDLINRLKTLVSNYSFQIFFCVPR